MKSLLMNDVGTPQSRCLIGVARGDITPPVGIYHRMWGAAVHERSTGVHRPLTATVMFMKSLEENGDSSQVVIAVDHCLLWSKEMNSLLQTVSEGAGVPANSLTVFFSHTHGAGLMGLERTGLPGGELIEPYLRKLSQIITGLVLEARRRLAPASIVYGQGECGLATHRDFLDEERGCYVCGFNPGGKTDLTVLVGRVTNDVGSPIATIVNYACHPTTLAWDNTLISPDYVGAMREVVEGATGVPCLFIQGASGDIGPREGFTGDVQVADRNGRQLGFAVLSALESLPAPGVRFRYQGPVVSGATLGTWGYRRETSDESVRHARWVAREDVVALKYRGDLPSRAELDQDDAKFRAEEQNAIAKGDDERARTAHAMVERTTRSYIRIEPLPSGEFYPFPIRAWRIGDAVWVALNGEHYNVLQRTLRERFPENSLIIGTIANGSNVWYLLDSPSYGRGLYQEQASVLAKGCLEAVIDAATTAIQKLVADGS
jgi:hypothetical protein